MSGSQPATTSPSLLGRIAVQLKWITMEQLTEATREQGRSGGEKRLGDILTEKGFLSAAQIQKLKQIQRDVIAKHRAKQALSGRDVSAPETAAPPSAPGAPATEPAPPAPVAPPAPQAPPPAPSAPPATPTAPIPPVGAPSAPPAPSVAQEPPPVEPDSTPSPAAEPEGPASLELTLPDAGEADRERLHQILSDAVARGASDLHLHSESPLRMRLSGALESVGDKISREDVERMTCALLEPEQRRQLEYEGEVDLCLALDGIGRFRVNVYRQQRGFDAVLRVVPAKPPTLEELGLPNALAKFTNYHQGMLLLTGPAGCGKSATMAALVNLINEEREEHILTVEDPIEVIHPSKRCLVNQRHAGRHTASFARALRGALREDPDVIVIGELRDLETISLAMTAAETGHFVLATLHTNNAVRTINRMIGAFPSNEQEQVRTMLSESLRAVVSQRLVPTTDRSSRVPALEILVINKAISNLVREAKTVQIRSAIQTGALQGMCLMEQSLAELVKSGTITREEALLHAEDKKLIP